MLKKTLLLFLSLLLIVGICFGQDEHKTPYEQKIEDLQVKYLHKIGLPQSDINEFLWYDIEKQEEMFSFIIIAFADAFSKSEFKNMLKEFEDAEKLKNDLDFQKEKEKEFLNSDYGKMFLSIKNEFQNWMKKEEFEKDLSYQNRLKAQSKKMFEKICISNIKDEVSGYNVNSDLKKNLSSYDTERGAFDIYFEMNDLKWESQLKINIEKAPVFKKNWSFYDAYANIYDWCLVDNILLPKKIIIHYKNEQYELIMPLDNQKEITLKFDDFDLSNPNLTGYIFNYSDARLIHQRLCSQYKDSITIVLNSYNRKLLANPYNVSKQKISRYKSFNCEGDLEVNYKSCVDSIQKEYEKLNMSVELELKKQDPQKYCNTYYIINSAQKSISDSLYIECRCDFQDRLDFDTTYINKKIESCKCRSKLYNYKYTKDLFSSKSEFDSYYNKGPLIVEKEIVIRYFNYISPEITKLKFKNALKKKSGLGKNILNEVTGIEVPEKTKKEETTIYYINQIDKYKHKPYYDEVISIVIENNNKCNKYWGKHGVYFNNKSDFYNAYISGEYRKHLRRGKKQ